MGVNLLKITWKLHFGKYLWTKI